MCCALNNESILPLWSRNGNGCWSNTVFALRVRFNASLLLCSKIDRANRVGLKSACTVLECEGYRWQLKCETGLFYNEDCSRCIGCLSIIKGESDWGRSMLSRSRFNVFSAPNNEKQNKNNSKKLHSCAGMVLPHWSQNCNCVGEDASFYKWKRPSQILFTFWW